MKKKTLLFASPLLLLVSGFLVAGSAITISQALKNKENGALKEEYFMNDII